MIAIIVILLLAVIGTVLTFYLRRPSVGKPDTELAPPGMAGLFATRDASGRATETAELEASSIRANLLDRARAGDVQALIETRSLADATLYNDVLDALIEPAGDSREKLGTLVSFISANPELRANKRLAELVMNTWEARPDRRSTVEMMHIAALSDDPATYQGAVELVVSLWQKGKLIEFRSEDLIELFESQFWMLAPEARRGGAAFALKQKLADVRRELAMTTPTRS